ncbi:MAG: flippase-like domain-containing protein, partial [Melioribacteraceae bacterium]
MIMIGIIKNIGALNSSNRKILLMILKAVITSALIYYLINIVEYKKVISALKNADYTFVIFACILMFVNVYLQFKKWRLICRNSLNISDDKKIFKSLLIGFGGGIVTPFKVGELVGRAVPLKNVGIIEITLATAIDKLFPLIIVSFAGVISALLFIHYFYDVSFFITVSLVMVFIALFYFLISLINNKKFWHHIVYEKLSRVKFLRNHVSIFKLFGSLSQKITWQITFITFLYYLTFTTQMAFLIAAFLHQYDLINYLWISSLVIFSQTIIPQITIAELGIREGSTIFFMNLLGLSAAAGFNAAILL